VYSSKSCRAMHKCPQGAERVCPSLHSGIRTFSSALQMGTTEPVTIEHVVRRRPVWQLCPSLHPGPCMHECSDRSNSSFQPSSASSAAATCMRTGVSWRSDASPANVVYRAHRSRPIVDGHHCGKRCCGGEEQEGAVC
jgi:hypothetical protein